MANKRENLARRPTKKQRELLSFVNNFISGHGYGPSYREIKAGLGYSSVATVALHIDNLIAKGHLRKNDNKARSLELVASADSGFESEATTASQEKWLMTEINKRFKNVEKKKNPSKKEIDDLYVLTGSLKVLGFEEATTAFIAKLTELKKKL